MKPKTRLILRSLSILLAILALATVLPCSAAREVSILGYKSICPFAPFSTVISLYLAWTIHRYLANTAPKEDLS